MIIKAPKARTKYADHDQEEPKTNDCFHKWQKINKKFTTLKPKLVPCNSCTILFMDSIRINFTINWSKPEIDHHQTFRPWLGPLFSLPLKGYYCHSWFTSILNQIHTAIKTRTPSIGDITAIEIWTYLHSMVLRSEPKHTLFDRKLTATKTWTHLQSETHRGRFDRNLLQSEPGHTFLRSVSLF